jgi:iron(III) transport system permease protein
MAATILVIGGILIFPIVVLLVLSFNTARDILVPPAVWGLSNWVDAWDQPRLLESLWNSFMIWFLVAAISFPIAIAISLILARTNVPFSHGLEFLFWVAYLFPSLSSTLGWMWLLAPDWGFLNKALELLPFVERGPFNIFSVGGIVWAKLMADGIAFQVILLTPAFRNMDGALEEASRVSGAASVRTMLRVTVPVMSSPIVLLLALQVIKVFQGFETEWILGARWGFFVYSTLIYRLVRLETIPQYADAIVLASITLLIIALVVPVQRWVLGRRTYTTVVGSFRPALIDLGRRGRWVACGVISLLIFLLTALPTIVLLVGSFMSWVGFFDTDPLWTLKHWQFVFSDPSIWDATATTLILSLTAGLGCPILFSILAYMIVRTRWRGRTILDSTIWVSASIPGILAGLGLLLMFLITPGLKSLFGTIWPLIIVALVGGATTGVGVFKGVMVQLGNDMEEAGRVSGAGWFRTYWRVVIPVLMPTMVLIGMLNFVNAAGMTSAIILLASRETTTLSLLTLEFASGAGARVEEAGILSLLIMAMTLVVALPLRSKALKMGVRHDIRATESTKDMVKEPI